MTLLQLERISKSFGSPDEDNYRVVLDELDLKVEEGTMTAILGPSGSGKTTLLNIIGTLDSPDSGKILFRDRELGTLSGREADAFRNQEIGFVFQFHHLLPQCTVMENVLIPTIPTGVNSREKEAYAIELMERVGILEYRDNFPGKMSGGECQRAAIVRAMINRPALLLADEPTGALDGENVHRLIDLLRRLNREDGLTVVLVTHSETLASGMDQVVALERGKINRK